MKKNIILVAFILFSSQLLFSQEAKEKVKLSGVVFMNYFYNLDNVNDALKDSSGFEFKRIFFTSDFIISETFDSRFRIEAENNSGFSGGGKIGIVVKDAYLRWSNIFNGSDIYAGITAPPGYSVSEPAWGYRSVEKTIMDLFGIVASRDMGVLLNGKIVNDGSIKYAAMIGNNSNLSIESDSYRRYYAFVSFKPFEGANLSLYGDMSSKKDKYDKTDLKFKSNNQFVSSIFLGYEKKEVFGVGVESFIRILQNNFNKTVNSSLQNQNSFGLSLWSWVVFSDKFKCFARYDQYDPNTDLEKDATSFAVFGLDYHPIKNVSIIPNMEVFNYQAKTGKDLIARVTLAYTF